MPGSLFGFALKWLCLFQTLSLRVPIIFVFINKLHIYHLSNMIRLKRDTNQQDFKKSFTSILSNLNNFYSLKVVNRINETQLQVGENSYKIIWRFNAYYPCARVWIVSNILKRNVHHGDVRPFGVKYIKNTLIFN